MSNGLTLIHWKRERFKFTDDVTGYNNVKKRKILLFADDVTDSVKKRYPHPIPQWKVFLCQTILLTLPISYREEAIEMFWSTNKPDPLLEVFQYLIGGIEYRSSNLKKYLLFLKNEGDILLKSNKRRD